MSNKNNIIDFQAGVKKLKDISNVPSAKTKEDAREKKEEKVVVFPGSRLSSIQQALDADEKFKTILSGRVISTLLGMFVLTVAAQSLWFSKDNVNEGGRGLASSTTEQSLGSVETYLSGSKRDVASVAKLPNRLEGFNFGALHGRYTIKTDGQFITSLSSNGRFIQVGSVKRFLKKHKNLWQLKFASLRLSYVEKGSKVYTLLNAEQKIVGKAVVHLDGQGNLQSLQFKKAHL